ncbi:MAG: alpha/beta fold hydrolase [Pseudomonadota bacterium]
MSVKAVRIEVDAQVSLEAVLSRPEGRPLGTALVLHPHPRYGGSMHNNVVDALAAGALLAGWAALKFNFRGVGMSSGSHDDGVGEQDDAAAAMAWLRRELPGPLALMGYSFGARVATWAAAKMGPLAAGVLAAPALVLGELGPWPPDAGPLLVLAGDQDPYTSLAGLRAYVAAAGARAQVTPLTGADHFLGGRESALSAETAKWLNNLTA